MAVDSPVSELLGHAVFVSELEVNSSPWWLQLPEELRVGKNLASEIPADLKQVISLISFLAVELC